jgi:DNA-binding CsgD family transcriptional regulator
MAALSPREKQVLALLASGYSNKEIARRLGISYSRVVNYLSTAYRVIGVQSRTEALLWWQAHEREAS